MSDAVTASFCQKIQSKSRVHGPRVLETKSGKKKVKKKKNGEGNEQVTTQKRARENGLQT